MVSRIEYDEMLRLFNRELKLAERFDDDELIESLLNLKTSFIELYEDK